MLRHFPYSFLALLVVCIGSLSSTATAAPQAINMGCGDSKEFTTTQTITVTGTGNGSKASALRAAYEQLESHGGFSTDPYICGPCNIPDACNKEIEFLPGNKPTVTYSNGPIWSCTLKFTGTFRAVCTSCGDSGSGNEPPDPPAKELLDCGDAVEQTVQVVMTIDLPLAGLTTSQAEYAIREAVKKKVAEQSGLGCSYCYDPDENFQCDQEVRFLDADPTILNIENLYNGNLRFTIAYVGTCLISCDPCPDSLPTPESGN
ncbi:MAG: hypothetical protein AAFZ65_09395 [Planctomycetota bacterium]